MKTIEQDLLVTESGTCYEGVKFCGKVLINEGVTDVTFKDCSFTSLYNSGENTAVLHCHFDCHEVGISSLGNGLYVRDSEFCGGGTAISATGEGVDIRTSRFDLGDFGIGVLLHGAENAIVAECDFGDAERSIMMEECFNTVAVRNRAACIFAVAGRHIYVCDNLMTGNLCAEDVDYILADGNTYAENGKNHAPMTENLTNVNGDTLTDVDARLEVGAKEDLLPHVDRELFVGMERKRTVRVYGEAPRQVYDYVLEHAKGEEYVILAPGVYETDHSAIFTAEHANTTLYGYGVMVEHVEYAEKNNSSQHISVRATENVAFKGLTVGYAQPSNGQVYILKKLGENRVLTVAGAGTFNGFSRTGSPFLKNSSDIGMQRAGTFTSCGDFFMVDAQSNEDGTITIELKEKTYETVNPGDILTCRLSTGTSVVGVSRSKNILFLDFTQYCYAGGFAFAESYNETAVTYYRMADTSKPGKIIDKETYDRYRALEEEYGVSLEISIDEKGRYRGAPAHISSIDGVHAQSCSRGSQIISCLFENLTDDASNQKGTHARLSEVFDNGDGTATVVYKGNMSNFNYICKKADAGFENFCAPFRKGDRVFVFTAGGQLVCDAPALSDAEDHAPIAASNCEGVTPKEIKRFAVKVAADAVNYAALEGYDLTSDFYEPDGKVLVDNMSRASYGFRMENTLVHNCHTNGIRAKASGGVITNCTFRNVAKTAVAMIFEIWWGESGVAEDVTFASNLVDNTGFAPDAPPLDYPYANYRYCPVTIMGLGGKSMDADHLLYKRIRVENNKFVNRNLKHYNCAIFARAACGLSVKGNNFGSLPNETDEKFCGVLYLNATVDVELSGNTYSPFLAGKPTMLVDGDRYRHVHGADVEENGVSLIADKL